MSGSHHGVPERIEEATNQSRCQEARQARPTEERTDRSAAVDRKRLPNGRGSVGTPGGLSRRRTNAWNNPVDKAAVVGMRLNVGGEGALSRTPPTELARSPRHHGRRPHQASRTRGRVSSTGLGATS